jgi:hypothetical protein
VSGSRQHWTLDWRRTANRTLEAFAVGGLFHPQQSIYSCRPRATTVRRPRASRIRQSLDTPTHTHHWCSCLAFCLVADYDICSIQDTTRANKKVHNLDEAMHENISDALRYAVCFWCNHLTASGAPESLLIEALAEFCQKHLFHWVEVLSLLEHVIPVETALLGAIEWCGVRPFAAQQEEGGSNTFRYRNTLQTSRLVTSACYRTLHEHCGSSRFPSVLTRCTRTTAHS